jgi:peptidoglycan/xylan/chitin deacetylase (PgdA/CDA1 family)
MKDKLTLILCLLLLILSAGCQEVALPETSPLSTPSPLLPPTLSPDSRLVALYFDDAFVNQYDVALPVLLQYGFRATFGVITGSIGTGHDLMEYMGKEELETLSGYGMEIAAHTRTHPHLAGTLTDEQLRSEIAGSKADLEEMGFTIKTLAYPYYEYDDRVIECVRDAGYVCARAGWSMEGVYDLNTTDPIARYHIAAWQITNQDIEGFKLILDRASRTYVVCLVYHIISDTGPAETSTSVADFKAQMSYLYDNGYTVVLLSELIEP